ncbi:MAG: hypothetical protein Q7Q73_02460, partial [Verrucomicrobiota bacterium JB024]|nr:hypothetical protein [Verrucomicrobiota bacterium JB024]
MTVPANYFPINGASPSGGSIITSIPWGFDSGELEFFAYRDSDGALEKSPTYSLSGSTLTVSNPFGSVAWSLFVSRRGDITQDVEDGVNNAQAIISQLDQLTKRTQEVGASSEGAVRFHGKLEPMVLPSVDERKGKIVGFDDVTGDLKVNPASADLAGSYAVASAASAAKAEAALNDVVTRYIGAFADDSAANAFASGEGIALADGTEYFKTGTGKRIYSGGVWMDAVNGLTEVSGDGRYLQKDQNGADISEAGSFRDNIGVFSRGLIRGRARTPLAEQPGVEPEGPLMPVTLTEAEFEALTEYEPRYYDVLGIGTYFGPKRIAWDTDVYDSSTGIHVATTGDDST